MSIFKPRFGQGPRIKLAVEPRQGGTSTTFLLTAAGLRPGEVAQVRMLAPDGGVVIQRSYVADADGAIGPLTWQPGKVGRGEYRLTVRTQASGEQSTKSLYVHPGK